MLVGCLSALYIRDGSINNLFYVIMPLISDLLGWVVVQGLVGEDKIWERSVEHMVNYGY